MRELRVFISKLEAAKISRTPAMNSKITIDSNTINVDDYTVATLKRFQTEIINDHRNKLYELEEEYSLIIYSPEEAFERVLLDTENDEKD